MENLNNLPAGRGQNHPPIVSSLTPTGPTRDLDSYAERFLVKFNELGREIKEKEEELKIVAEQSMSKQEASKDAYKKLMATIKSEIKELENKRDNLHTQETTH